jgi:hypothetical protein
MFELMEIEQNATATAVQPRRKYVPGKPRRPARERSRYNGNSREHHRVRALAAGFRAQLGDASLDPIMSAAITRAAELTMLAEMKRAAAIRGEDVDLGDLIRLEGAARRAVADLRLPIIEREEKGSDLESYLADNGGAEPAGDAGRVDGSDGLPDSPQPNKRTSGRPKATASDTPKCESS